MLTWSQLFPHPVIITTHTHNISISTPRVPFTVWEGGCTSLQTLKLERLDTLETVERNRTTIKKQVGFKITFDRSDACRGDLRRDFGFPCVALRAGRIKLRLELPALLLLRLQCLGQPMSSITSGPVMV